MESFLPFTMLFTLDLPVILIAQVIYYLIRGWRRKSSIWVKLKINWASWQAKVNFTIASFN